MEVADFETYTDGQDIPLTDRHGDHVRVLHDVDHPYGYQYVLVLAGKYTGTIVNDDPDGRHHRFAAWSVRSGTLGRFGSLDTAADAIAATYPRPSGPGGTQFPLNTHDRAYMDGLSVVQQYNVTMAARRTHQQGHGAVAIAWAQAVASVRQRQRRLHVPPDEAEFRRCCASDGSGRVHTSVLGVAAAPLCGAASAGVVYTDAPVTCAACARLQTLRAQRRRLAAMR